MSIFRLMDNRFAMPINRLEKRIPHIILSVTAHSGDSVIVILCFGLLYLFIPALRYSVVIPAAAGILITMILTLVIKYTFKRTRPEGDWGGIYRKTDPYSFPSGHAARSIAIALIIAGYSIPAGIALFFWSFLVGISRIILRIHYPSDVAAGFLLGLFSGGAVLVLFLFI